jgi:probable F420-dependent oxidoreductase
MRFGLAFPTAREGTSNPVSYIHPRDFVRLAQRAEALGFYSLWGNDHLSTPGVVQATGAESPNAYEPLITFAALANVTERLRFMLGIIIMPQREPVLLAKQAATLDVLSGGRLMLGVGVGGYRDEFVAIRPDLAKANRSVMLEEGIQALRVLFNEPRASFEGRYIAFRDVEIVPKPVQQPLPILVSGRGAAAIKRAARFGDGWVIGEPPPEGISAARDAFHAAAREAGRDPQDLPIHSQIWACFDASEAEAEARLKETQHFRRALAEHPERTAEQQVARFRTTHLFGTVEQVIEKIRGYESIGIHHLNVVFSSNNIDELLADMEYFAEQVMPSFAESDES